MDELKEIHRVGRSIPMRILYAYMIIIIFVYAYTYHISTTYGDVIGNMSEYDILGKHKCLIDIKGCNTQVLTGWSIARVVAYAVIGYGNPHGYLNMFIMFSFIELYSYANNSRTAPILNMFLNMIGYTVGSSLCPGSVC